MNDFPEALAFILKWEGGFVDDPVDPGGATNFGIAQHSHPEVDVRTMSRETAELIYLNEYFGPLRASQMPCAVSMVMLDWAVHSGLHLAVRRLQHLLGIPVDGIVGPATLAEIRAREPHALAMELLMERASQQSHLIREKPELARFVGGWTKRLIDLASVVSRLPA